MKLEVKMPTININDDTVSLCRWLISDKEVVSVGQPICEVETSKAIEEILSPSDGMLHIQRKPGDVKTGAIIAYILGADAIENQAVHREDEVVHLTMSQALPRFSLKARTLMEERNLEPSLFNEQGLVRKIDVLKYLGEDVVTPGDGRPLSPSQRRLQFTKPMMNLPSLNAHEENPSPEISRIAQTIHTNVQPFPKRKLEEIKVLSEGHLAALPSVVTQLVDITGLQDYLDFLSTQETMTVSSIVTYEVARLLVQFPEFHATYTPNGVMYHPSIHIGMAIDAGLGLKVPAILDANEKGIQEISREMEQLLDKYHENRLTLKELTSATFNISDLSSLHVPWFTPLISQNQSAILGIGSFELNHLRLLSLTLTFDHRVTEGKRAALFLQELKQRLLSYMEASRREKSTKVEQPTTAPTCYRCLSSVNELPATAKYLFRITDVNGMDAFVCQHCMEGW